MPVNVAVVGAGHWGKNLVRNFANLPECRLAYVCDLDPNRLSLLIAEQHQVPTTTHLDEVLADIVVDAVVVATPAEIHYEVAEACLKAGKHIFVEKPLASSSQDAEAIVRLAEAEGRLLMAGHLFLYDPAVSELINMVQTGAIGQIRYINGVRTSMSGTARLDTNIVWDALIHDVYILSELFERDPERVLVVGQGYLSPDIEDMAFVTFDFGDGALAQIYVSWYALEKERRMTVIGSDSILAYDDLSDRKLMLYDRRYERSDELDPQGRHRWHWRDDGGRMIKTEQAEPLRAECEHFLECIQNGKQPKTDGQSGAAAVHILEACQRSLDQGGVWVEIGR